MQSDRERDKSNVLDGYPEAAGIGGNANFECGTEPARNVDRKELHEFPP